MAVSQKQQLFFGVFIVRAMPLNFQHLPLSFHGIQGADLVVESLTKTIGGHSDLMILGLALLRHSLPNPTMTTRHFPMGMDPHLNDLKQGP